MRYFCNPLNLEYKYQHLLEGVPAHREAADPTLIYFKGTYYMFASMSGGFWYSDNLIDWTFHEDRNIEIYLYAPDVFQVGEYIYFSASRRFSDSPILRSKDPLVDGFEPLNKPFQFWDPHTYQDDDGKVYFYWGCSNRTPMYGVEMNPETMEPLTEKKGVIYGRPDEIGWENVDTVRPTPESLKEKIMAKVLGNAPFVEGAFMAKHGGKYYLQYAAPGTEFYSYGDGVYVADHPLGDYKMQKHNPFSTKPGGFIKGAGHGSTIQDKHGNWWHASTMCVTVNASFERRLGLFPCGFDKDGILFCNQNFADYPYNIPDGKFDPQSITPQWMLLSYNKKAVASSSKDGHPAEYGVNESIQTSWCAASANSGEWYTVDLGKEYDVRAIQVNFADVDIKRLPIPAREMQGEITQTRYIDLDTQMQTQYELSGSVDGETFFVLENKKETDTSLCHDFLLFENGIKARYIIVTGYTFPYNAHMAISGLRVFGNGDGTLPEKTKSTGVKTTPTSAFMSWKKVSGATGYNLRYGIAPDKLYSSWLVYGETSIHLPLLNKGQQYFFCVDSFSESGITTGDTSKINTL